MNVVDANELGNNLETTFLQAKEYEKRNNMSNEQEHDVELSSVSSGSVEINSSSSRNCYSSCDSESGSDVGDGTPDRSYNS